MVGRVKGQRVVLSHFITREHLEGCLLYAQAGDLVRGDAQNSQIPSQKTKVVMEEEEVINRGRFLDLGRVGYYFNCLTWLPLDRKTWNGAKRALLGRWTDGVATITFCPESRVTVLCPPAGSHPLYIASHENHVDRWEATSWMVYLMNEARQRGERLGIYRCDEHELHVSSKQRDRLVHVFHRDVGFQPVGFTDAPLSKPQGSLG